MDSPKDVGKRLGNLSLQSGLAGHTFAFFNLFDLPKFRVALLSGLEVASLFGVALDTLRCLLVIVVDVLFN